MNEINIRSSMTRFSAMLCTISICTSKPFGFNSVSIGTGLNFKKHQEGTPLKHGCEHSTE